MINKKDIELGMADDITGWWWWTSNLSKIRSDMLRAFYFFSFLSLFPPYFSLRGMVCSDFMKVAFICSLGPYVPLFKRMIIFHFLRKAVLLKLKHFDLYISFKRVTLKIRDRRNPYHCGRLLRN